MKPGVRKRIQPVLAVGRKVRSSRLISRRRSNRIKVEFIDEHAPWDRKVFCVTHADRPTELSRCNLNFLEKRFGNPDRFTGITPFSDLAPIAEYQPFGGTVTVWSLDDEDLSHPRLMAFLRPDYKPQHAMWHKGILWVLGVDRLVLYQIRKTAVTKIGSITDPWLSGAHTVAIDGRGRLLVSCSASDSILVVETESSKVVSALRLPESMYGRNYDLRRNDSTVDHYIHNDIQLTHVNCAWPWRGGIVLSTLAQGAIGWFDSEGTYREFLRGFVGCHGVRARQRTETLYFSDSSLGVLTLLDANMGVRHRIHTGSVWLHDSLELSENVFAVSCSDRNQVEFIDIATRSVVGAIPCADFGLGPQFLYYGV
jgi:hypothetical protein